MPSLPSTSEMRSDLAAVRRKEELSPQAVDFAKECGAQVQYNADGSWEAVVKDKSKIRRAMDMMDGARRVEIERGARLASRRSTETLVLENGRTFDAPEHLSERIAKKRGLKAKAYYGRPSERWVFRSDGTKERVF